MRKSSIFAPRGVAVIGVSQDPVKLGYGLARNLMLSNYQGAVHFINPHGGNLFGRPVYPSILQAPDPLDLAILLIPAQSVPPALEKCGQRGVRVAVIGSGGFRETGPEGAALEARCLEIARQFKMRLIGPNSIGFLDTHAPIDATFLPPPGPLPGDVAFISHSGAICAAVIDWARGQSFGLSRLVSLGNQADLNETEMLASIAADPFTRVVTMYLEGVRDGRRFIAAASQVTCTKPVIALKVGRYSGGQRAVASHTGALAGSESAFNAAFRRAGVIRAETSQEMFDWARALAWCSPPQGRAVAVLTNAGGPGATAADALEAGGLQLASLTYDTRQALKATLPAAASLHNPVDMLASASPEQYAACLRSLLDDTNVHSVLVILPPPPMYTAGAVAKALIPVIHASHKPVVIALMGERLIQEAVEHFRAARVPEYRFPERAASALATLAQWAEYQAQAQAMQSSLAPSLAAIDQRAARRAINHLRQDPASGQAINRLFSAYGIPVMATILAHSAAQARKAAERLGYPLALKIASPDITHKSDVNGVLLDLHNADEVAQGYTMLIRNARQARPQARLEGVYLQRMAPGGQEVILGAIQDVQFGALVMFGSGGVEVEGLKDVAFALAPLSAVEADYLLENTWAGRKLAGFRSLAPADREAAIQAVLRLGQLAADFPEIQEIEINPLRVLPPGQGVVAIDGRVKF